MNGKPLLSVRGLSVDFSTYGRARRSCATSRLDVPAHRHVALVGESGCGKSVTMRAIMGILSTPPARIAAGEILFDGRDLLKMRPREREGLRGTAMSMVFQDPMTSLNPVFTIGDQMGTILKYADRRLGRARNAAGRMARIYEVLGQVRMPDPERIAEVLSDHAVGRHAPARADRDGAALRTAPADRRRAGHGARRHDPGPDPEAAARISSTTAAWRS